jgi:L-gulonate 5-dehydrogenase
VRAAVTRAKRLIEVVDVPEPGEPGEGHVVVRPEAVGLCGSDFHYFLGDLGAVDESRLYPRVQGHEVAGVVEAVGPGCPPELRPGERVAIWPVSACGSCYPCRIGRGNVCANIRLVGILEDAPEAMAYAIGHPAEVMKAVIRLDSP